MIHDEHDPMCPTMIHGIDCDACDLIARVRADERERAAERIENAPWAEESWIAYEQRIIDLAAARGGDSC